MSSELTLRCGCGAFGAGRRGAVMTTELALGAGTRLVRKLGEGATSVVWLVEREGGAREALKLGRSAAQRPRFAEEAARLAGIRSPALVALRGAGVLRSPLALPDGTRFEAMAPYLLLECAEGEPLHRARVAGDAALRLALSVARDIGGALADLHAAGLAHGDVKPHNILVDETTDSARLLDLGLAADASEALPRGGTRRYLAPEVSDAAGRGDARLRDLWA